MTNIEPRVGRSGMDGRIPRVLVVTADMGAGHREVAAELTRRLQQSGAVCADIDVIAEAGRAGRRLQRTYRMLLDHAPWAYGLAMRLWARWPRPFELITAANAGPFERILAEAVRRHRPDVIVSTYNLASQCLGRLRSRGDIGARVLTLVTDPGAHPYWISRGVDVHLAPTSQTASDLRVMGAAHTRVVAPLVRPEFLDPPSRLTARAKLDMPEEAHVVLVTAGSWAVGDVDRTLDLVRSCAGVSPVVLCGRDRRLAEAVGRLDGVRAVPWTPDVIDYLCAADVVIDNAGGLTCWEALACRTRVVLFRPLPGHGLYNARTLHAAGLATWVRTAEELCEHISPGTAQQSRPTAVHAGADAARIVLRTVGHTPADAA